jgi:hypothetical protein
MGTRADFYIGEGKDAEWLGSVAYDGYKWAEQPDCRLMTAKTEDEFQVALLEVSKERGDWTSPDMGWPWPWDNSFTTDFTYSFHDGKTNVYNWGLPYDSENPDAEPEEIIEWPNMAGVKNVTFGGRSGVMILGY